MRSISEKNDFYQRYDFRRVSIDREGSRPYACNMNALQIALISSEIEPFAKTGGLADMVGSFSRALLKLGHTPTLFLPRYRDIPEHFIGNLEGSLQIPISGKVFEVKYFHGKVSLPAELILIDPPDLFDRPGLYGDSSGDFPDNCLRFTVFCRAALEWMRARKKVFDILHCHDWQTALIPLFLKSIYRNEALFTDTRTVLSLHNMAYQGIFPSECFPILGLEARYQQGDCLEYFQNISLLKGGIVSADALTTVSPTYAREILNSDLGFGMQGVLRQRQERFVGILNGIDEEEWDPETSPELPFHFSADSLLGKAKAKAALQAELGLPVAADTPLFGSISRLVDQKGIDLLLDSVSALKDQDFQWAVLGKGEARFESRLKELSVRMPKQVAVRLGYDVGLSHRLTAGTDFLAMPSRFEPCGYNQLYALRYGSLPLVHGIGGLKDSVKDWKKDPETATGIVLDNLAGDSILQGFLQALKIFRDPHLFQAMRQRAMKEDFTWRFSAQQYVEHFRNTIAWPKHVFPPNAQAENYSSP